jgi:hypothetical protein
MFRDQNVGSKTALPLALLRDKSPATSARCLTRRFTGAERSGGVWWKRSFGDTSLNRR